MTKQRVMCLALMVALMTGLVSAVGADDHDKQRTRYTPLDSTALQEATGLDAASLREALQEGATPAELIEANGGDVAAVVAAMAAEATAQVEGDIEARQANLGEEVAAWLEATPEKRRARKPFPRLDILAAATGVEEADLLEALRDGATPAELITANDGDVAAVADEMIAAVQTMRAEEAAEHEAALTDRITAWVNGESAKIRSRMVFAGTAVTQALGEATGLDEAALREALENGASVQELIEANGGDVEAVLTGLAENALESMRQSRAMFAEARAVMDELFEDAWRRFRGPRMPWRGMPRLLDA